MKRILIIIGVLCAAVTVQSQGLYDALRYTQTNYTTNARAMAVGGAFGALGSNSLSSSINPAGVAMYPTSEFTFSTAFLNATTHSNYLGQNTSDVKYALNIPNISFAFTEHQTDFGKPVKEGWVNHSFAMNLNRSNSFGSNNLFNAINTNNGMVNFFAEDATEIWNMGYQLDSTSYGGLGYFGYLIDPVEDSAGNVLAFAPSVSDQNDIKYDQLQSLAARGNISDLNFGWAGNYSNKFYVGVNLGIPLLNYREEGTYRETNLYGGDDNYNSMELKHTLKDNGVGVNLSAGLIYKPFHFLRLGVSAKTPTFFSITRSYDVSLTTDTDAGGLREIDPRASETQYRLITPYTFTLSGAAVLFKQGFVSVDYSITDPSTTRLRGAGLDGSTQFLTQNQSISDQLTATSQLRMGGEWRFGPLAVRGGYSITNSPFANLFNRESAPYSFETYSGGLGFRENDYFFDLGFQTASTSDYFSPYSLSNDLVLDARHDRTITTVMATFGYTF